MKKSYIVLLCLLILFVIGLFSPDDSDDSKQFSKDPIETLKENDFTFEYSEGSDYISLDIKGHINDDYILLTAAHDYSNLMFVSYIGDFVYDSSNPDDINEKAQSKLKNKLEKINIKYDDFINQLESLDKNYKTIAEKEIPKKVEEKKEEVNDSTSLIDKYGRSAIQDNCKHWLEQILKSPSSAKYPGSFFNPDEGWDYDEKDGVITVQSYVDSQNSFGADIRSDFVIKMEIKNDVANCTYLSVDGTVYTDKYN